MMVEMDLLEMDSCHIDLTNFVYVDGQIFLMLTNIFFHVDGTLAAAKYRGTSCEMHVSEWDLPYVSPQK